MSENGGRLMLKLSPKLKRKSDLVLSPTSHTPVRDAGWSPADLAKESWSTHAPAECKP